MNPLKIHAPKMSFIQELQQASDTSSYVNRLHVFGWKVTKGKL